VIPSPVAKHRSRALRIGAGAWIAAALGYFAAEAVAAASVPDYSYATDYISALGVPGRSPHANLMNVAFVAQAVLFPLGAVLVAGGTGPRKTFPFLSFALLNGIGNVLIAFVHSGAGSALHVVGAAMAIACGNAAILAAVPVLRRTSASPSLLAVSIMLGALGLLSAAAVAFAVAPIGVWERVSVYSILGWQTVCALYLVRQADGCR
jgi:hypothetical protein